MGFLHKLFGSRPKEKPTTTGDPHGIYLYAQCDHCGSIVRLRADKQHDLLNENGGYIWHKTIVDSRCFRRMQTIVHFDSRYQIVSSELQGGKYVSEADYEASLRPPD